MALQEKTEDWLLPYLEGAYVGDAARQAELEARLAADPALAAEAAQMRRTLDAVRGVAVRTPRPAAAVPADSWPRLKARLQPAPRRLAWGWLGGAGAAVTVAAGVIAIVLPGHHAPTTVSSPPQRTASQPAPPVPSAAKTAQKPPQVAQTAPTAAPTGPLATPNLNGLSDPFVKLPVPPPLPGTSKVSPPVVIKPMPPPQSKPNPQIALRDIGPPPSPEVVHPLLPLPVAPPLAPAPAAPPLPVSPPAAVTAPPVTPPRFERKMLKMPPPASADNAPAGRQAQAFDTETAPAAPPAALSKPTSPPAAAFGGGGFSGRGGLGGAPGRAMNRMAVPTRREPASADSAALLTAGTRALAEAVAPPLWGKNEGMQQSNETLTDVREAGLLGDLQTRLESRRAQMPRDLTTGRMLAAVYDFSSTAQAALHERQRVASLDGADGEDFFQLGQAEGRAGNTDAARAAYRRALTSSAPPSGFHVALARQGAQ